MFGIDQQIARLETLTCEMSRKLDTMIGLLQRLVERVEQPRECNSGDTFTITIDELDAFREFLSWTGQSTDDEQRQ